MASDDPMALLLDEPIARKKPLWLSYIRDLNAADLQMLSNPPPLGSKVRPLLRIRHQHHQLARLLADGHSPADCSRMTGYCSSRISGLRDDPAFAELIAYYTEQKKEVYLDVHQRLADTGVKALEILNERMEEEPEKMSSALLKDIVETAFDRSVAPAKGGPKSGNGSAPSVVLNVQFVEPQGGAIVDVTASEVKGV